MRKTILSVVLLALAVPAWGATTLNLKDADIGTLIATVSEVTGRNFIVDERVKGKVTVISSRPMSSEAVYETFLAVLAVKGFAAVPAGSVIKIVQDSTAKHEGGARLSDGAGRPGDDLVTHVYQIENVSAAQLVPILRPLVPTWGHLVAYGPSNMLIISDRAANVVRLGKLIGQIDRAGDREVEMVSLQHASAPDIVRILTTLTQQDKQADPTVKAATVIADERSNSVLIGGDKSERQKLLDIISQLDVALTEDGATQVIYLRHANAENLAPILEGYAQQTDSAARSATPATPAGGAGGGADGRTRIIADKDTNALVITGSPKSMKAIRSVIAQLDIKRSQVLVEAVIAEVSASKSAQLGLDWAVFNENRIAAAGILNPNTLQLVGTAAAASGLLPVTAGAAAGAGSGLLEPGLTAIGGVDNRPNGTSIGAILRALQGDTDTNVLSTPSVVATDNEESELSVGQELSIATGAFTTGTGGITGNPFQTTQRKDVGLKLVVTPQINEGDSVNLKLNLEVSQLQGDANSLNPVTSKRTLNTVVTVVSGQVLVLGGLIDDQVVTIDNSIPFLSKIPLIGALFQYNQLQKIKRNLVLFIRPAILRDVAEADYYTRRKYDSAREAQIEQQNRPRNSALPRGRMPVLPTFEDYQGQVPSPAGGVPARQEPAPQAGPAVTEVPGDQAPPPSQ